MRTILIPKFVFSAADLPIQFRFMIFCYVQFSPAEAMSRLAGLDGSKGSGHDNNVPPSMLNCICDLPAELKNMLFNESLNKGSQHFLSLVMLTYYPSWAILAFLLTTDRLKFSRPLVRLFRV